MPSIAKRIQITRETSPEGSRYGDAAETGATPCSHAGPAGPTWRLSPPGARDRPVRRGTMEVAPGTAASPSLEPSGDVSRVIWILFAMLGIILLAGLVVVYVAFPHRGEEVPNAPWVGEAMRKGVNLLPTLDNQSDEQKYDTPSREKQHH